MARGVEDKVVTQMAKRLIVALDVPTVAEASDMVARLDGVVSFYKIGHHLLLAPRAEWFIDKLIRRYQVFLDLKLRDIPATVEAGVKRAAERGATWVTVNGDYVTISAAINASVGTNTKIFAVGSLSSEATTIDRTMVENALMASCHGVIAPASTDCVAERGRSGLVFAAVGIRMPGEPRGDHSATKYPSTAIRSGADYLIVGRSVVGAGDSRAAALAIIADMQASS